MSWTSHLVESVDGGWDRFLVPAHKAGRHSRYAVLVNDLGMVVAVDRVSGEVRRRWLADEDSLDEAILKAKRWVRSQRLLKKGRLVELARRAGFDFDPERDLVGRARGKKRAAWGKGGHRRRVRTSKAGAWDPKGKAILWHSGEEWPEEARAEVCCSYMQCTKGHARTGLFGDGMHWHGFVLVPRDPRRFRPVAAYPADLWSTTYGGRRGQEQGKRFATNPRRESGRPQRTLDGLFAAQWELGRRRFGESFDPFRSYNEVWVRAGDVVAVPAELSLDWDRRVEVTLQVEPGSELDRAARSVLGGGHCGLLLWGRGLGGRGLGACSSAPGPHLPPGGIAPAMPPDPLGCLPSTRGGGPSRCRRGAPV